MRPDDRTDPTDHAPLVRRAVWAVVSPALGAVPWRARPAVLRAFGATVGSGVVVQPGARVARPWLVRVEGPAWIGAGARIDHRGPVVIGREACLAPGSRVGSGTGDRSPITVGTGAWVGPGEQVRPGATVADRAVVAGAATHAA